MKTCDGGQLMGSYHWTDVAADVCAAGCPSNRTNTSPLMLQQTVGRSYAEAISVRTAPAPAIKETTFSLQGTN